MASPDCDRFCQEEADDDDVWPLGDGPAWPFALLVVLVLVAVAVATYFARRHCLRQKPDRVKLSELKNDDPPHDVLAAASPSGAPFLHTHTAPLSASSPRGRALSLIETPLVDGECPPMLKNSRRTAADPREAFPSFQAAVEAPPLQVRSHNDVGSSEDPESCAGEGINAAEAGELFEVCESPDAPEGLGGRGTPRRVSGTMVRGGRHVFASLRGGRAPPPVDGRDPLKDPKLTSLHPTLTLGEPPPKMVGSPRNPLNSAATNAVNPQSRTVV
eukprot:TRINITY_DN2408_c0_g1_i1.p1 TRINITY_DN2408_c0_g1~~TRINITY_DN2408_c0_g1_i1.p1  ORF type:complete len:273 (+),score=68.28 TRINITY_DN2408_c0_g1_i1:148-966(+)